MNSAPSRLTARGVVEDARIAARLLTNLPRFLRTPFTLEQARATLRARFEQREDAFLRVVVRAVEAPSSPYRRLFAAAGCTLEDVARLVAEDGVETTLERLFRAGLYLSVDEFKGRRPVVRGSTSFDVFPRDLVSAGAVVHGVNQSSGSRGPRTAVPIDLAFVRDHAINTHLTLDAHGGRDWVHAHWGAPGGTALTNLLEFAKGGRPAARWFTPVDPHAAWLHPRYRIGARAMRLAGRGGGVRIPSPERVPLDDPLPLARWLHDVLRSGRTPHVWTFASSAALAAQAATAAGIDLTGARFTAGGEPTTAARRATVAESGAVSLPRFGTTETDIFAYACRAPTEPDDMHLLDDRHAVIQAGDAAPGLPPRALLVTSLLDSAPFLLLNLSLGDHAYLVQRSCDCPLERLGWTRHLHTARSFEKLTAGGLTFLDTDVIGVLEEHLPARFGGGPTDYQLVEDETESGRPCVWLVVDPRVGTIDEAALLDDFLSRLGSGAEGEAISVAAWRAGGVVRVVRRTLERTASGKILHLHRR